MTKVSLQYLSPYKSVWIPHLNQWGHFDQQFKITTEFVENHKGNEQLVLNRYIYELDSLESNGTMYWRSLKGNWIGRPPQRGRTRRAPTLDIKFWYQYDRIDSFEGTLHDLPKTNNKIEGT